MSEEIEVTLSCGDVYRDLGVQSPTEALAESWASIDGKLDYFRKERGQPIPDTDEEAKRIDFRGHYEGYMEEAAEMITRLAKRGFSIVPTSLVSRGGAVGEEFPGEGE